MINNAAFDASIPVLTEVFQDHPVVNEAAPAAADAPAPAEDEAHAETEACAVGTLSAQTWELMERRLSERILHQLQDRVDLVLEQTLRVSMQEAIEQAVAGLAVDIRLSLQATIEQIVVQAVAQELTHLQTAKT